MGDSEVEKRNSAGSFADDPAAAASADSAVP